MFECLVRLAVAIPLKVTNKILREIDRKLAITAAQREIEMWADTFGQLKGVERR